MAFKDMSRLIVGAGLAGVNMPEYFRIFSEWQHPFQELHLTSDLHVACIGAHQGGDGAVIIAAITSCTNTSNPRNVVAAALLARKANELGLVRKPWVKSSFAPGSKVAELYLKDSGLLPELEKLGFGIVAFACTTCNGMSGALDPKIQQEIIDRDLYATAVLSGNRNFDGRIHPYAKQAFLASPPLVIAYAIAGTVRFDIEKDALGFDADGNPITLKDIWPSDAEIDAVVKASVKPDQFRKVYEPMFNVRVEHGGRVEPLYAWRPQSTYIRRPPYWEGALAGERTLRGMRPLAVLGDNITTDHLSPSNAILASSAAGEYLAKMGLPEEDFNSYATHRGDHLTAQRATFANPQLVNEMAVVDGEVKKGSLARIEPDGQVVRMWEAIETYMERKQPLIIIAGADYGQGSSRDWAAKGVRLAGVEAIVAEGFERIHRTNLIGMGVLPLEFLPGTTRKTLGLDGSETYDVIGLAVAGKDIAIYTIGSDGVLALSDGGATGLTARRPNASSQIALVAGTAGATPPPTRRAADTPSAARGIRAPGLGGGATPPGCPAAKPLG